MADFMNVFGGGDGVADIGKTALNTFAGILDARQAKVKMELEAKKFAQDMVYKDALTDIKSNDLDLRGQLAAARIGELEAKQRNASYEASIKGAYYGAKTEEARGRTLVAQQRLNQHAADLREANDLEQEMQGIPSLESGEPPGPNVYDLINSPDPELRIQGARRAASIMSKYAASNSPSVKAAVERLRKDQNFIRAQTERERATGVREKNKDEDQALAQQRADETARANSAREANKDEDQTLARKRLALSEEIAKNKSAKPEAGEIFPGGGKKVTGIGDFNITWDDARRILAGGAGEEMRKKLVAEMKKERSKPTGEPVPAFADDAMIDELAAQGKKMIEARAVPSQAPQTQPAGNSGSPAGSSILKKMGIPVIPSSAPTSFQAPDEFSLPGTGLAGFRLLA